MEKNHPAYWKEPVHNNCRRAPWHDYRSRCIYMITFNKAPMCPAFSAVALDDKGGGVLVSPFISKDEKAVRSEAEALNAKIILLTNEAFPERYKPAAHDFSQCTAGRLLIIAPAESLPATRSTFLRLNALAAELAESEVKTNI